MVRAQLHNIKVWEGVQAKSINHLGNKGGWERQTVYWDSWMELLNGESGDRNDAGYFADG